MTHFQCSSDEVRRRFAPIDLARLKAAESICPWGPSAENLRMECLAKMLLMVNAAEKKDRRRLASRIDAIYARLWGKDSDA